MSVDPDVMEYVKTTPTYDELKKKFTTSVAKERFILLEEIKFAEQLQQRSKELEMKLDAEAEEIYFEGPGEQLKEALIKFIKIHQNIVEKQISVSKSILEVLGSDEGLKRMKCELKTTKLKLYS